MVFVAGPGLCLTAAPLPLDHQGQARVSLHIITPPALLPASISHLECPIKSSSDSSDGALMSRRLLGHERPGSCPTPLSPPLSPPSGAPPPRRSGTIAGQRHFLKRVVVPVWGPRRLAGKEEKDGRNERPCGAATLENERLLSSAGCGCQSLLRSGRKRSVRGVAGELLGVLHGSGPAEVAVWSHTLIFIRNLSDSVLALTPAATVLSLPAPPYLRLTTT